MSTRAKESARRRNQINNQASPGPAAGSPVGPGMSSPGACEASGVLCPQARRAWPAGPIPPDFGNPRSPASPTQSTGGRLNDQAEALARHDLCEVFNGDATKDAKDMAAGDNGAFRPLSSVSTSAGCTPSPEGRASPHAWPLTPESHQAQAGSPGGPHVQGTSPGSSWRASGIEPVAESPEPQAENEGRRSSRTQGGGGRGGGSGAPRPQAGKVFVGGVPQDMSQDDLYKVFSEFGRVKKAWLQSYRSNSRVSSGPPNNHRGFGFVIFYDGEAVDNMIGKKTNMYIKLRDGRRLDVKRAVPSSDISTTPPPTYLGASMLGRADEGPRGGAAINAAGAPQPALQTMPAPGQSWPSQSHPSWSADPSVASSVAPPWPTYMAGQPMQPTQCLQLPQGMAPGQPMIMASLPPWATSNGNGAMPNMQMLAVQPMPMQQQDMQHQPQPAGHPQPPQGMMLPQHLQQQGLHQPHAAMQQHSQQPQSQQQQQALQQQHAMQMQMSPQPQGMPPHAQAVPGYPMVHPMQMAGPSGHPGQGGLYQQVAQPRVM